MTTIETDIFTFGEFLRSLLNEKNISVAKLAELTETKSRNAIQRLLNDSTSIKIVEDFAVKLAKIDVLELLPMEIEQLDQAIEVSRAGKNTVLARKVFLDIFSKSNKSKTQNEYSKPEKGLFSSYTNFSTVQVLIFGSNSANFNEELLKLILRSTNTQIFINQIVNLEKSRYINAVNFASTYRLINYKNYDLYYSSSDCCNNNIYNIIVIDKETTEGSHQTDIIKLNQDGSISELMDTPGKSLFNFFYEQFEKEKAKCKPIKKSYEKNTSADTIVILGDLLLELEQLPSYRLSSNMGIGLIPKEILHSFLRDSCYMGLSENHPTILTLMKNVETRINNYHTIGTTKINVFTKRGLLDFVKNKIASDHVFCFRPFTNDEIKQTLNLIIDTIEAHNHIKILLEKDNYFIDNLEITYFKNQTIWICDSSSGFDNDFFDVTIDAKPVIEVFDDFIDNELLKNHVYPESETIDYIKYLISTLD